jgi:hypothetical protein
MQVTSEFILAEVSRLILFACFRIIVEGTLQMTYLIASFETSCEGVLGHRNSCIMAQSGFELTRRVVQDSELILVLYLALQTP